MPRTFQLIAKLSLHPVTAAIYLHEAHANSSYAIVIERWYEDHTGTWTSDTSFRAGDLPLVRKITKMAEETISELEGHPYLFQEAEEAAA